MPVLRRDDEVKSVGKFIYQGNDLLSFRNFQASTRDEIILQVNNYERSHGYFVYCCFNSFLRSLSRPLMPTL